MHSVAFQMYLDILPGPGVRQRPSVTHLQVNRFHSLQGGKKIKGIYVAPRKGFIREDLNLRQFGGTFKDIGASLLAQKVKIFLQCRKPRFDRIWSLGWEDPLEKGMATTPVFLLGEFQGQGSLASYSPWGLKELEMTEWLTFTLFFKDVGLSSGLDAVMKWG